MWLFMCLLVLHVGACRACCLLLLALMVFVCFALHVGVAGVVVCWCGSCCCLVLALVALVVAVGTSAVGGLWCLLLPLCQSMLCLSCGCRCCWCCGLL